MIFQLLRGEGYLTTNFLFQQPNRYFNEDGENNF